VQYAVDNGETPSLIVAGGDAGLRALTAATYVAALDAAGVLSASDARWVPEVNLPSLEPMPFQVPGGEEALYDAESCPLLVISEIGEACREDPSDHPDIYGNAPYVLFGILDERTMWNRATVITSGLPVGNPPVGGLAVNDPTDPAPADETEGTAVVLSGPNRGLQNALDFRAAAGWQVPSSAGGYDPDALLVDSGTLSLQQHLGGKAWWRTYMAAFATAVDAGDMLVS
jgi:hypothetical protein